MRQTTPARKANRTLLAVLVFSGVLVATNLGEFWPFSIYPMFSQGGNSWSRALVREFEPDESISWETSSLDTLPGDPVSVASYGVDPIDLANFVSKTDIWSEERVHALDRMFFGEDDVRKRLLVFRVNGRLETDDEVVVESVPYVFLDSGLSVINPALVP